MGVRGGRWLMWLALSCGCSLHEQVQHFEAVDPVTGHVNYYRMTIRGHGLFATDYHMQAGYFSAASIDVLRGQMPSMPEVDLPVEQDAAFDELVSQYYAALVDAGERLAAAQETESHVGSTDDAILARARLVWFGQLTPADVASMGMNQTSNPFQFRKLVFWVTAKNVDLQTFGTQIDAMIAGATSLVRAHKAESKRRRNRARSLERLVQEMVKTNPALAPYAPLADALFGSDPSTGKEIPE